MKTGVIQSRWYFERLYDEKPVLKSVIKAFYNAGTVPIYCVDREDKTHRNNGPIDPSRKIGEAKNFRYHNSDDCKLPDRVMICDVILYPILKLSNYFCNKIDNYSIKMDINHPDNYQLKRLIVYTDSLQHSNEHLKTLDPAAYVEWSILCGDMTGLDKLLDAYNKDGTIKGTFVVPKNVLFKPLEPVVPKVELFSKAEWNKRTEVGGAVPIIDLTSSGKSIANPHINPVTTLNR